MNIAIDMMGGDFSPLEAVKGLQQYFNSNTKTQAFILCIGDETKINPLIQEYNLSGANIKIVHAPQSINYHESPTKALKEKQESSIVKGFNLLASGKVDAFISAGNTGAMLIGSKFIIKPIEGVQRPTIATLIPKLKGGFGLCLDVGLNTDCKPPHLEEFALLGSLYAQNILKIDNPKIALLNIGEEEGKGDILTQAAYPLLKESNRINFVGNIEGRDLLHDFADVVVCDGFTGNVVLKLLEAFYDAAKNRHLENDDYFKRLQYDNYGGIPVLGIAKPVIIGHGISNAKAFCNMIILAETIIKSDFCELIKSAFQV